MRRETGQPIDPAKFLTKLLAEAYPGQILERYKPRQTIFSQGEPADSLLYVKSGRVALGVVSSQGKEAVIAILGPSDLFGEECLAGQKLRTSIATSMSECAVTRIDKDVMARLLRSQRDFCQHFISYLIARNARMQDSLASQLFYSSEKRLARVLISLARAANGGEEQAVVPRINQQVLADMVGTTRSRVSYFMNNFKKRGFIDYDGELKINIALLNLFLRD